jgi:p-hydroxybenzoate 3-monooxygenase
MHERTTVAIIGAGPAGLLLGHILGQAGIDYILLEQRSREYCLSRIRAGVLEQGSVELLRSMGLDAGLRENGLIHDGIYLQFEGERHHVDFRELVGQSVTVYGQQALVSDLIEEHERLGSPLYFDVDDIAPSGLSSTSPRVHFVRDGVADDIECDVVVGADGYHGVCRRSVPDGRISAVDREYPFAWLGILADVAPSTDELIYDLHPEGFAMHSMRSLDVSRLYLQVDTDESIDNWSDERIWGELQNRMAIPGWTLNEGTITEKSITPMRSFVVSTLNVDKLFLVGDAGHIVPPTGAKGLNSAIADVGMLGRALVDFHTGSSTGLERYSDLALARQWKVQQFSQWMTDMLHVRRDDADAGTREFRYRSQLGQLHYTVGSVNAMRTLAEQYVGLAI